MNNLEEIIGSETFMSDMVAAYVHDVKNCLNFLMAKADAENDTSSMHVLMEANYKLNHLLMLYKAEGDMLTVDIDAYSPVSLMQILAADYQQLTEKKVVAQEGDETELAYFDKGLISLCVGNAISNADHFASTVIELSYRKENGMAVFAVRDDGNGFSQEILDNFGSKKIKSEHGSGLGLYLSMKIAQQHVNKKKHGFIKIYNDGGAVFEIHLP